MMNASPKIHHVPPLLPDRPLKLLHTSDWHLGRLLYGQRRYAEFAAFLDWLAATLRDEGIDVLLIAGDVFDTGTPSNQAQALYYQFLCRVAETGCRHVVIIAGNHDSPSFLEAPRELLQALNVHVIGHSSGNPADEVRILHCPDGEPALIVCAVPYLRDRDLRQAQAGETLETKERKLLEGLREHYAAVTACAQTLRGALDRSPPIVAMGHLFTAGGQTIDGDGVRDLYIGSLAHVTSAIFPPCCDYVALGHLHVPQKVNGQATIRYSGSPIPMGFGEANQQKSVCIVTFDAPIPSVRLHCVPTFQRLARVRGDWPAITAHVRQHVAEDAPIWLEIIYDGDAIMSDLRQRIDALVEGSRVTVLRIQNTRVYDRVLRQTRAQETLADLDETEVFERCLAMHAIADAQRADLRAAYREILALSQESTDSNGQTD